MIDEAEKRKAKAKAAAEKRASMPKKTPATKNKEAVEKTAGRIEKNVEKRAKKGDVTVSEIEKLISEYEDAIKNLRALITKIKADGKMSMGGGVGESHAAEYRKIKNHTCKCGDKMAEGGGVMPKQTAQTYTGKDAIKGIEEEIAFYTADNGTIIQLLRANDRSSDTGRRYYVTINGRGLYAREYREDA